MSIAHISKPDRAKLEVIRARLWAQVYAHGYAASHAPNTAVAYSDDADRAVFAFDERFIPAPPKPVPEIVSCE